MLRVPKYRSSLVDPYREHLRKRRAEDPAEAPGTAARTASPAARNRVNERGMGHRVPVTVD
ncbi:hypothetical protein, partial [Streptomyces sp. NPDC002587]